LPVGFPLALLDVPWKIILVDSPEGHTPEMPGRQQSIFAASLASRFGATVFLHDYNRPLELEFAKYYLGEPSEVVGTTPTLAVFNTATQAAAQEKVSLAATFVASPSVGMPRHLRVTDGTTPLDVSVVIPTHN